MVVWMLLLLLLRMVVGNTHCLSGQTSQFFEMEADIATHADTAGPKFLYLSTPSTAYASLLHKTKHPPTYPSL